VTASLGAAHAGASRTAAPDSAWPAPAVAWRLTIVLTAAYMVSFLDRYVIALLIEPIKASMALTDLQVGLLLGPAFALFYLTLGIPLGWLADRRSRRDIVAVAIALWSVMTALCGLAASFWPLFLARVGVGVGEAALAPSAVSMIGDSFPLERRARPIGFYMNGSFLGSAASFLLGGSLVAAVEAFAPLELPGLGALAAWQAVFIIVGLPGVLLALLLLTIREPARRREAATIAPGEPRAALAWVRRHWRGYGTLLLGMSGVFALGSMAQWNVALFQRNWQWSVAQTGIATGIVILATALPGTTFSGWLSSRLMSGGRSDGPLRVVLLGLAIFMPASVLMPLMPSATLGLVFLALGFLGQAIAVAAGPAALVNLTPSEFRSQAAAVYWSVISVIGLLLGPSSVGALADALGGPAHLRTSMAVMSAVFGIPSVIVLVAGAAAYRRSLQAAGFAPASQP
jgi:MFS family permease